MPVTTRSQGNALEQQLTGEQLADRLFAQTPEAHALHAELHESVGGRLRVKTDGVVTYEKFQAGRTVRPNSNYNNMRFVMARLEPDESESMQAGTRALWVAYDTLCDAMALVATRDKTTADARLLAGVRIAACLIDVDVEAEDGGIGKERWMEMFLAVEQYVADLAESSLYSKETCLHVTAWAAVAQELGGIKTMAEHYEHMPEAPYGWANMLRTAITQARGIYVVRNALLLGVGRSHDGLFRGVRAGDDWDASTKLNLHRYLAPEVHLVLVKHAPYGKLLCFDTDFATHPEVRRYNRQLSAVQTLLKAAVKAFNAGTLPHLTTPGPDRERLLSDMAQEQQQQPPFVVVTGGTKKKKKAIKPDLQLLEAMQAAVCDKVAAHCPDKAFIGNALCRLLGDVQPMYHSPEALKLPMCQDAMQFTATTYPVFMAYLNN